MAPSKSKSSKTGRGYSGRHGVFSDRQNALIEESMPAWHRYSLVQNPELAGRGGGADKLTEWKQTEAKKIIGNEEFGELPLGLDYKQTLDVIVRKFTNYRNNRKRNMEDRTAEVEAMKEAAAALLDLKSFSKGRNHFKQKNEMQIRARRNEILASNPGASTVGAYQTSLKELWSKADQELWETAAAGSVQDIHENQLNFPRHLYSSLRGLCQVGGLGYMEAVTFFAFRNRHGHVDAGVMEAHHDDEVVNFSVGSRAVDDFREAFEVWAKEVIPMQAKADVRKFDDLEIEQTADGLPLFPSLDLESDSLDDIRRVLMAYFGYLWKHSHPGKSEIPWEKITTHAKDYYDPGLLGLTFSLAEPTKLSKLEVYALTVRLIELSSSTPFSFRISPDPNPDGALRGDEVSVHKADSEKGSRSSPEAVNGATVISTRPAHDDNAVAAVSVPRREDLGSPDPHPTSPTTLSRIPSPATNSHTPSCSTNSGQAQESTRATTDATDDPSPALQEHTFSHWQGQGRSFSASPAARSPQPPPIDPSHPPLSLESRTPTSPSAEVSASPASSFEDSDIVASKPHLAPVHPEANEVLSGGGDDHSSLSSLSPPPPSQPQNHDSDSSPPSSTSTDQQPAENSPVTVAKNGKRKVGRFPRKKPEPETEPTSPKVTRRRAAQVLADSKKTNIVSSANSRGRKRSAAELTDGDEVQLRDGRRGTIKRSKFHTGAWFHENGDGKKARTREWINDIDEQTTIPPMSY